MPALLTRSYVVTMVDILRTTNSLHQPSLLPNVRVAKDTLATCCQLRATMNEPTAAEQTLDKLHSVWSLIAPGHIMPLCDVVVP